MARDPKIVPLFGDEAVLPVAEEVSLTRSVVASKVAAEASQTALDLTGKPKVIFLIGAGNTGKTTMARWMAERFMAASREGLLAAIDPENRELGSYFEGVHEPPSFEPAAVLAWLERFLGHAMERKLTAAIDLGGGDTTLSRLVASTPLLVDVLRDAGVEPVAFYVLSPRVSDLTALDTLERAGFQPTATALILNDGRTDPTASAEAAWATTRAHSVFRAAVERGVVVLRMPRLIPAKGVEDRRITFAQARDGTAPAARKIVPLGPFDRSRVAHWLATMDTSFAPVASWLP